MSKHVHDEFCAQNSETYCYPAMRAAAVPEAEDGRAAVADAALAAVPARDDERERLAAAFKAKFEADEGGPYHCVDCLGSNDDDEWNYFAQWVMDALAAPLPEGQEGT
jgi:hypothetical protein